MIRVKRAWRDAQICIVLLQLVVLYSVKADFPDQVVSLPGWGNLTSPHFAGQIPIDSTKGSSIFYWYQKDNIYFQI
jgi:hypothetical protein